MKMIVAYVQPHAMEKVQTELTKAGVGKMSITNAVGCGQQRGFVESYRGLDFETKLIKKVRFEVAVNEDFLRIAIDAIVRGARTGEIGDGKIFVMPIAECVRIRSGEEGEIAIG